MTDDDEKLKKLEEFRRYLDSDERKRELEEIRRYCDGDEYKREDRRWWAWCDDLVKEEHADFAWVPEFLDVFDACYEAYNFGDITDVGEVREYDRQQWQWCRIWCFPARQYHWRWIPACGNCGFARCPTTCPSYWIIRTAQRADGHRVTP
jgi:hypothetical protein